MRSKALSSILGLCVLAGFGMNAFAAPSIRTANVKTTTATPNAAVRAGTLKTQPGKSVSISTPARSTSQVSAPSVESSDNTERMPMVKGIKNSNINALKDTTATNKLLNQLDSRINELTEKIDNAEAIQNTVVKEAEIERKIEEKVESKTYTKTEVDNLLNNIKKKLPTIDDKGNLTISDSTGTTSMEVMPYYLYASNTFYGGLAHSSTYRLTTPHNFGTSPWTNLAQQYTAGWVNDICAPEEQSNPDLIACGYWYANGTGQTMSEFHTISCIKGFGRVGISNTGSVTTDRYTTFENLTESQIHSQFCGNMSTDACSISEYTEIPVGVCTAKIFKLTKSTTTPSVQPYYFYHTQTNFGNLYQNDFYRLTQPGSVNSVPNAWITDICSTHQSNENVVGCGLWEEHGEPMATFSVSICYKGFFDGASLPITDSNGITTYRYMTFENLTEAQARNRLCEGLPVESCWISSYVEDSGNWGNGCTQTWILLKKRAPEPEYWLTGNANHSTYDPRTEYWYMYSGYPSSSTLQTWENTLCEPYSNEFDCCINNASHNNFWLEILHSGYKLSNLATTTKNGKRVFKQNVTSYEYTNTTSLQAAVCGTDDDCWVEEGYVWENAMCGHSQYEGYVYRGIAIAQQQHAE